MNSESELRLQAESFATEITDTIQAVLGRTDFRLQATLLGDKFTITSPQTELIELRAEGAPLLDLKVRYECGWDFAEKYLAVIASEFHVFARGNSQPLFRYEFVREAADSIPAAHIQVHAHRDAFTWAMTAAGQRSRRAKKRAAAALRTPPSMQEAHFPVGGRRFRPALEDVLQMLVEEFGIEATDGWRARLADAREKWRRSQVKAVVRDAPADAATSLRELGYRVEAPTSDSEVGGGALRQY